MFNVSIFYQKLYFDVKFFEGKTCAHTNVNTCHFVEKDTNLTGLHSEDETPFAQNGEK